MSDASRVNHREMELLPIVARTFVERGYAGTSMRELAQRCGLGIRELKRRWPNKTMLFIAAVEFAYESAERTWKMLLEPDPPLETAERLLAFAAHCGDHFTVSQMFSVGLDAADRPRIRNTLRRMNRRLARFLANEVTNLHIEALAGSQGESSLRSQAGSVLRQLAHVQQQADELAETERDEMIEKLRFSIERARESGAV